MVTTPRQPKRDLTPAQRAAALRNLEKAHEAERLRGRSPAQQAQQAASIRRASAVKHRRWAGTPLQLLMCRKNLEKARARQAVLRLTPEYAAKMNARIHKMLGPRTDEGYVQLARKRLKHGVFSRMVRDAAVGLGENPRDYKSLMYQARRLVNPRNEQEQKLADLLGKAMWRYHRVFFAQGHWEIKRLLLWLRNSEPLDTSHPVELMERLYGLLLALRERGKFFETERRLRRAMELIIRRLIRLRTGHPHMRLPRLMSAPDPEEKTLDRLPWDPDLLLI